MSWCRKCDGFVYEYEGARPHLCPPAWWVCSEDELDDRFDNWTKVLALDAEAAAEKWAEDDDSGSAEYHIVSGNDAVVFVENADRDPASRVRLVVSGESVATYSARAEPAEVAA